jgi:hypothetical protein
MPLVAQAFVGGHGREVVGMNVEGYVTDPL